MLHRFPAPVPVRVDAKSALVLSAVFGLAGAITVPALLPALPPEARSLPLPVPVFSILLSVQLTIVYGALALAGLRLARASHREPAALLTGWWSPAPSQLPQERVLPALCVGLASGCVLVVFVAALRHLAPQTLPDMIHPPSAGAALSASVAAAFGEEILFRLFALSLLLRLLSRFRWAEGIAVCLSALVFGAAHAPACVFLFGGLDKVPGAAWVWLVALNGICGAIYGVAFLRWGILSAISAHFGTDVIWHVASQLFPIDWIHTV